MDTLSIFSHSYNRMATVEQVCRLYNDRIFRYYFLGIYVYEVTRVVVQTKNAFSFFYLNK
jgi:hypothetical protein